MDHLHIVAIRDCIVKVRQGTSRIEYISVFHLHLLLLLRKN